NRSYTKFCSLRFYIGQGVILMRQRTVEAVNTKKSREFYALDFSYNTSDKLVFSTNFDNRLF
ncbi:MAG TPA: hypothetical protein PKI14_04755, partial [Fervidobacterium sp.]|nr:hypothetical protein [Fervidobacterium sp.]HUM42239.1 hypothetical protein [Fervidobacterium sp.]